MAWNIHQPDSAWLISITSWIFYSVFVSGKAEWLRVLFLCCGQHPGGECEHRPPGHQPRPQPQVTPGGHPGDGQPLSGADLAWPQWPLCDPEAGQEDIRVIMTKWAQCHLLDKKNNTLWSSSSESLSSSLKWQMLIRYFQFLKSCCIVGCK